MALDPQQQTNQVEIEARRRIRLETTGDRDSLEEGVVALETLEAAAVPLDLDLEEIETDLERRQTGLEQETGTDLGTTVTDLE